ncbi:unnamed protein product [Thlaspi arvense]|uniref:GRF-type domain-containing protein n=1 Tax=Thlaspi arvense TaxID=13288 RepID=A0AAU9TAW6_THLAR|nr:unnamed protein product [Thlaspi arvense]
MGDSASSSIVQYKNEKALLCNCDQPAKIMRAWTDANTGRRFYGCVGRKVAHGYESCNFFCWFDVEKPHGWQHEALIEARDVIRDQREEIRNLREAVKELKRGNPNENLDDLKQAREECEALKLEVLILNERSRVFRNVLITSSVGFTIVLGVVVTMCK